MIKNITVEKNILNEFTIAVYLKKNHWMYFQLITEKLIGSQMGIFFNDELISAPIVPYAIEKGLVTIYISSQDKAELVYKSLGGKNKRAFVEKKRPDYHNDDYYPDGKSLAEQNVSVDSIFLLFANSILSTPDDYTIEKRNDILNDILDWFLKYSEKEYLLGEKSEKEKGIEPNSYTLEISSYDQSIVPYYIVSLTKAFTENRNLSDAEVKIKATEYLVEYVFQKANYTEDGTLSYEKIKQNKLLKSLKNKKNIKRLVDSIG